jgi:acyl-CoA thioester hydrolase
MKARTDPPPLQGFTIEIPVRFAECDSYGVVWHGHYALYLEEVRDRLTARFGFTPAKALQMGYRVPVTRLEIRYRAPARPDETIRATARLRPPEVARLVVDYEIRGETGDLLASAQTEQVVVRADGELLLSLPAGLKRMTQEILAFQDEGASL